MALPVSCDECFTAFDAPEKAAGKRVRCPTCGAAVKVRAGGAAAPAPVAATSSRKRRAAPASGGPSTGVLIGAGVAALLVVGGGALAIGLAMGGGGDAPAVVADNDAPADPPAPAAPDVARRDAARPVRGAADPDDAGAAADAGGDWGAFLAGGARAGAPEEVRPADDRPADDRRPDGDAVAGAGVPGELTPGEPAPGRGSAGGAGDGAGAEDGADDGVRDSKPTGAKVKTTAGGLPVARTAELQGSALVRAVMPSVVRINNVGPRGASLGSGYVVHPDGLIVTNYHVVAEASRINVEFEDGTKYDSPGFLLVEPKYDIAIIKIEPDPAKPLVPVPIAPELPEQGAAVAAFGTPQGLNFSFTDGRVSAVRDEGEMENTVGKDVSGTWVQTDASISSGNSGGPLCDSFGNVVAMNTMVLQTSGSAGVSQNLNFAISCVSILDRLKSVLSGDADLKEWDADSLKEYEGRLDRKLVENELGTNKGKRLLAGMTEVLILPYGYKGDPQSGAVWRVVRNFADKTMGKADLGIIWERPDRADFTVLLIKMDLKQARRRSTVQELVLTAELVVPDLEDDSKQNLFCRVWSLERSVGTASLGSLMSGSPPRGMQRPMVQFFDALRRSIRDARKEYDAGELDENDRLDGGRLAASGEEGLFEEYFRDVFEGDGDEGGAGPSEAPRGRR